MALAALLVATVGGCGDDEDTTPASTSTSTTQSDGSEPEDGSQQDGDTKTKPSDGAGLGPDNPDFEAPPLRVSGGGSDQFIVKGGDNSVASFGEESDESELREAAEAVHGFYAARAEGNWADACARFVGAAAQTARRPRHLGRFEELPRVPRSFTTPLSDAAWAQIATVDAVSLRLDGEQAFLLYRGAGGDVYTMPLREEDGEWKVTGLSATVLGSSSQTTCSRSGPTPTSRIGTPTKSAMKSR